MSITISTMPITSRLIVFFLGVSLPSVVFGRAVFAIFIGFITIFYNQAIGSILGAIQHLRQGNKVKYVFIAQHKKTWPVDPMCRLLGVTRGGYYGYQRRGGGGIDYYRQE